MELKLIQYIKIKTPEFKTDEFRKSVENHFYYLESIYHFKRSPCMTYNAGYPQELKIEIQYIKKSIGISVCWHVGDHLIEIRTFKLRQRKRSFNAGYSPAITLNSFFEKVDQDINLMKDNMPAIIETLSNRLLEYGDKILKGETSKFPKVQEYHKKL